MKQFFITGSSRGIGKALCEEALQDNRSFVTGIARGDSLSNERYNHVSLDLSDPSSASAFKFPALQNPELIVLINNAGTLGTVARAGDQQDNGIVQAINVNVTSLAILTNNFINAYRVGKAKKVIINISSGAGKTPIDGWSIYCATKAAVDLYSRVIAEEQKIKNEGFRIFSIAPGIVDTQMQDEIRSADRNEFSRLEDFINYKRSGELAEPRLVAKKILSILDNTESFKETVFSVRDF